MEVQTIEKKPVATGKQTVTATEETSAVAERTKEVIILVATADYANTRGSWSENNRRRTTLLYTKRLCASRKQSQLRFVSLIWFTRFEQIRNGVKCKLI